jgi:hypothetical protein
MLSAVVVLPTPPFRFTTATTLMCYSIAQLLIFFLTLMFLTLFYLTLFYQTQILQTLILFTLICMIAIRPAVLRCGLDLLQLLYVQGLSLGQRLQCQSLCLGLVTSPCSSQALWVASDRVFAAFASLAPGPGMASAAAVSALDPEPLFVLSAKRKFLSVYQGLRKEAAA